jgi:hypothetical protein
MSMPLIVYSIPDSFIVYLIVYSIPDSLLNFLKFVRSIIKIDSGSRP